jgi:predicted nucleotidyltransferase
MPVRSLSSSVLKWPDAAQVDRAARTWADALAAVRKDVLRIGYFGSYARGDWGVGSDLDLLVILRESDKPFIERALEFDLAEIPVPAELIIYTQAEWERMRMEGGRLVQAIENEAVWLV